MDRIGKFVDFVAERQRIHLRRVAGQKPPWTEDPALANSHFCNVYRELDPGTQYMHQHVLADVPLADNVFRVMVYRLFGLERSWHVAFQDLLLDETSIWQAFSLLIKDRSLSNMGSLYTGAYMVNSYSQMGTGDKLLNIMRLCLNLALGRNDFRDRLQILLQAGDRRAFVEHLASVYGWGPFLAYQVTVDLSYPRPEMLANALDVRTGKRSVLGPVLGSNDGYVLPGPGTLKGLQRLGTEELQIQDFIAVLQEVANRRLWSEELADSNGRRPLLLLDHNYVQIPLTKANIANCLCEYEKYCALQEGGRPKLRAFDPVRAYRADRLARGDGTQIPLLESEERDAVSVRPRDPEEVR